MSDDVKTMEFGKLIKEYVDLAIDDYFRRAISVGDGPRKKELIDEMTERYKKYQLSDTRE